MDQKKAEEELSKKFWKTHRFNPVTQSFFNPNDEKAFKQVEEKQVKEHIYKQKDRLPEGVYF